MKNEPDRILKIKGNNWPGDIRVNGPIDSTINAVMDIVIDEFEANKQPALAGVLKCLREQCIIMMHGTKKTVWNVLVNEFVFDPEATCIIERAAQ